MPAIEGPCEGQQQAILQIVAVVREFVDHRANAELGTIWILLGLNLFDDCRDFLLDERGR